MQKKRRKVSTDGSAASDAVAHTAEKAESEKEKIASKSPKIKEISEATSQSILSQDEFVSPSIKVLTYIYHL